MRSRTRRKIYLLASFFFLFILFNLSIPTFFVTAATETVTVSAIVEGTTPPAPTVTSSRGGGGRGEIKIPKTSARFSSEAYPDAVVTVLKNGAKMTTVKANDEGLFNVTLEEKYSNTNLYSLIAEDVNGNRSSILNYPMVIYEGYLTHLSGIRFPPTIIIDKIEANVGDYLTVEGYALPKQELQVIISAVNIQPTIFTLTSRDTGVYNITFPLLDLSKGDYSVHVKYLNDTRVSKFVKFSIGEENIKSFDSSLNIPGDFNADGEINLVDFSVLAFWYKKDNPKKSVDINKDGIVDLIDFSILAFYWTT